MSRKARENSVYQTIEQDMEKNRAKQRRRAQLRFAALIAYVGLLHVGFFLGASAFVTLRWPLPGDPHVKASVERFYREPRAVLGDGDMAGVAAMTSGAN